MNLYRIVSFFVVCLLPACGSNPHGENRGYGAGIRSTSAFASVESAIPRSRLRLFILSGQSNMARWNPLDVLKPKLQSLYPNDEILIVKFACGGQPIRRWYKQWELPPGASDNWTPNECPPISGYYRGDIYNILLSEVRRAIQGRVVDDVYFFWAQGEADAFNGWGENYEHSLRGVISQLKHDLNAFDMVTIIGRISDYGLAVGGPVEMSWRQVRAAQSKIAREEIRVGLVNSDDLNGFNNGIHYTPVGYRVLAERFALHAYAVKQRR